MDRGAGDRDADRRDGNGRRAQDQLAEHQRNAYAHGELIGRLQQEYVTQRERFENRLGGLEKAMPDAGEKRIGALERFRAQATVIGAIALVVLGAVAGVVAARLIGAVR